MPVEDVGAGVPGARQNKDDEEDAMVVDMDGSLYFSVFCSLGVNIAQMYTARQETEDSMRDFDPCSRTVGNTVVSKCSASEVEFHSICT